jgi:hypothetical protein
MIRPHWKEAANTRISGLITLRYVEVGLMRQKEFVSRIQSTGTDRVKRAVDVYRQLVNANFEFDRDERHLGVIVWENAFASTPSREICLPVNLTRSMALRREASRECLRADEYLSMRR